MYTIAGLNDLTTIRRRGAIPAGAAAALKVADKWDRHGRHCLRGGVDVTGRSFDAHGLTPLLDAASRGSVEARTQFAQRIFEILGVANRQEAKALLEYLG